jgi:predicted nucleic acid-binding protein
VLCDTGPLVALFDPRDAEHAHSRAALKSLDCLLLTTWPVLAEVSFFLEPFQQAQLWDFVIEGGVDIASLLATDLPRFRSLMSKYSDLPMDLADASLLVIAERLGIDRIYTLDSHFRIYRLNGARSLEVISL